MGKYIMALDQGTTSSRCILFDHEGRVCAIAQKEFTQIYPKPGWVEHDPMEIWSSQLSVAIEALGKIREDFHDIHAIGITNQRETTIVWDKRTGKPVYPAIVWQCRRTADRIEQLKKDGMSELILERTGLIPDAYFSATKIAWILDEVPGAREEAENGNLLFGTVDTWLIWNLTNGKVHVTDYTNASRTMLFNIHNKQWDQEILDYFRIPSQMLPEVKPSGRVFGYTENTLIGGGIPIAGAAGDQQAALFGQCCFDAGEVKNTYGTGCFLLMNTGKNAVRSNNGLLTTIGAGTDENPDYVLEGSVFVAGAALQWLRDELKMIGSAPESMEAANRVKDTAGVYVVPAFTGLGAPYWNPYARGMIVGLSRGANRDHIIRATLESLAFQSRDVIHAMEKDMKQNAIAAENSSADEASEHILKGIRVDGGASNNDFLMQFQADLLGTPVYRPASVETTALGACYLAGLATGFWKDKEELRGLQSETRIFTPSMETEEREELLKGWKRAIRCALAYTEE